MARILQKTSQSISSLPDSCEQKTMLEGYVTDPRSSHVNLVLTFEGGQFVGYIGYPDKSDLKPEYRNSSHVLYHCNKIRSHDQVAKLGDRISEEACRTIFPNRRV